MKFKEIFESIPSDMATKIKALRGYSVGFKGKKPSIVYRGISPTSGSNAARFGKGLYTTTSKQQASAYGKIVTMGPEALPTNPLFFDTELRFESWFESVWMLLGYKNLRQVPPDIQDISSLAKMIDKTIDGVQIGSGSGSFFTKFPIKDS